MAEDKVKKSTEQTTEKDGGVQEDLNKLILRRFGECQECQMTILYVLASLFLFLVSF